MLHFRCHAPLCLDAIQCYILSWRTQRSLLNAMDQFCWTTEYLPWWSITLHMFMHVALTDALPTCGLANNCTEMCGCSVQACRSSSDLVVAMRRLYWPTIYTLVAPKTAALLSWTLVDHCGSPQRATPKPIFSICVLQVLPPLNLLTTYHPCHHIHPSLSIWSS